jgi:hypothetical protein
MKRPALLVTLVLLACDSVEPPAAPSPDREDTGPADATEDAPLPSQTSCEDGLLLRGARARPGGVDLLIEVNAPPPTAPLSLGGRRATTSSITSPRGLTGLVVAGPDADAAAFLRALPEGERVVVWQGKTLVAEATTDREHAARRVETLASAQISVADVLAAELALRDLEGPLGPEDRALVVGSGTSFAPRSGVVNIDLLGPDTLNTLLARRSRLFHVSSCLDTTGSATLTWGPLSCAISLPERPPHLEGTLCDLEARDPWNPTPPRTLELVMSSTEAALARDLAEKNSRDPFTFAINLGLGSPIRATARYRGHTSLECDRKSYAVDLDGGDPRRLMAESANDEFFLISMCRDAGYFNQLFGNRLARELGLFPLAFEVVRLVESSPEGRRELGAYLLLEDPEKALRQDLVDPWAILRRRFDPEFEPPDVDYATDETAALAVWDEIEALAKTGNLSPMLDSDAYLRWVALNTFLENEDWIDEVFFYASLEAGTPYFRVMGWDPDDLFSPCHHGGRFAFDDPHDILYCAEGDLERALLENPEVYARFIDALEDLIAFLTPEYLESVMANVESDLFSVVSTDPVAAAMIELNSKSPEAKTATGFRTVVGKMMADMLSAAERSRANLKSKIATWRALP